MKIRHQLLAAALSLCATISVVFADPPAEYMWTQTFGDEFDGTSLNQAKWGNPGTGPGAGGIINNELQCYSPSQVSVHDGKCWFKTEKGTCSYGGQTLNYKSGRIDTHTKFLQQYGYFEARCKLPRGRGLWPTFWLFGADGYSAGLPEFDILETINQNDGAPWGHAVVYYAPLNYPNCGQGHPSSGQYWQQGSTGNPDLSADFHTYGLLWTHDSAQFYLDDRKAGNVLKQQLQFTDGARCGTPMILNVAVNPTYGANDAMLPAYMQVDWVRAWQYTLIPADNSPPVSAPSGLTGRALSDTKIMFQWSKLPDAADPESGIKGYAVYLNSGRIKTTRDTIDTITGLTEATQYSVSVAGVNWRDLEGPKASVTATTLADVAPPTIPICYAPDSTHVVVYFSEPVSQATAETPAHYAMTGGVTVTSATLDTGGTKVLLTTSSLPTGVSVTMTVTGVADRAKVANTCNATIRFSYPQAKGVIANYYEIDYRCRLPQLADLAALTPQKRTVIPYVVAAPLAYLRAHNFVLEESGVLLITRPDTYTFALAASDGAALYFGSQKIIDIDGCRPRTELSAAPMQLAAGAYPIHVVYGDSATTQKVCYLFYTVPGGVKVSMGSDMLLVPQDLSVMATAPAVRRDRDAMNVRYVRIGTAAAKLQINSTVAEAQGVTVSVYDAHGAVVGALKREGLNLGLTNISLENLALAPGHYVCSVRAGGRVLQAPFMVAQ